MCLVIESMAALFLTLIIILHDVKRRQGNGLVKWRKWRSNFSYICNLSNGFAFLQLFWCEFDCLPTFETWLHSGPTFCCSGKSWTCFVALNPYKWCVYDPEAWTWLYDLTQNWRLCSPSTYCNLYSWQCSWNTFLFLCHRALLAQNMWASTGHMSWVTAIILCVTKMLAVFALIGSPGSLRPHSNIMACTCWQVAMSYCHMKCYVGTLSVAGLELQCCKQSCSTNSLRTLHWP